VRDKREDEWDGHGDTLVAPGFACPRCGERRMDWLPIDEETDLVTCGTCSLTYDPLAGQEPRQEED
jgi:transcription elongation factor Elf1